MRPGSTLGQRHAAGEQVALCCAETLAVAGAREGTRTACRRPASSRSACIGRSSSIGFGGSGGGGGGACRRVGEKSGRSITSAYASGSALALYSGSSDGVSVLASGAGRHCAATVQRLAPVRFPADHGDQRRSRTVSTREPVSVPCHLVGVEGVDVEEGVEGVDGIGAYALTSSLHRDVGLESRVRPRAAKLRAVDPQVVDEDVRLPAFERDTASSAAS